MSQLPDFIHFHPRSFAVHLAPRNFFPVFPVVHYFHPSGEEGTPSGIVNGSRRPKRARSRLM